MNNQVMVDSNEFQFTWPKKYRTKSLPFSDKIPFIRSLIIDNIPKSMLKKIYLFGSYAYGRPTRDSDIDICIVVKSGINVSDVYKMIHIPFCKNNIDNSDILIYQEKTFKNVYNPKGIEATIAKKGILLYG